MRVKKFDFIFIAIAVIIIAVLMVNTGGQKPHRVPSDEKHRSLLEEVRKGTKREEVKKFACRAIIAAQFPCRKITLPRSNA